MEVHFLLGGVIGNGKTKKAPKTVALPLLLLLLKLHPQLGHKTTEVQKKLQGLPWWRSG